MPTPAHQDLLLTPAEKVVCHLLERILTDHHILYECGPHSRIFDLVCEAEAARRGCTAAQIREGILRELGTADVNPLDVEDPAALRIQRLHLERQRLQIRNDHLEELVDAAGLRAGPHRD